MTVWTGQSSATGLTPAPPNFDSFVCIPGAASAAGRHRTGLGHSGLFRVIPSYSDLNFFRHSGHISLPSGTPDALPLRLSKEV
jgi:hypothetical protein